MDEHSDLINILSKTNEKSTIKALNKGEFDGKSVTEKVKKKDLAPNSVHRFSTCGISTVS